MLLLSHQVRCLTKRLYCTAMSIDSEQKISLIKQFVPKLTAELHKGQCGRMGVVGGSYEYTGAPYFSGMSAMKLGVDLVHLFCAKEAGFVLKSYSPDLIVHPLLDDDNAVDKIKPWLKQLHVLVIGPGLGRNEDVLLKIESLIRFCSSDTSLPLIIDADGLFLMTRKPELASQYKNPMILTPNLMEYPRLCRQVGTDTNNPSELAKRLSVVLVQKGFKDLIFSGDSVLVCDEGGCFRRCGGQGDLLAGFMAAFVAWQSLYGRAQDGFGLAAYAACFMTRRCSRLAFEKTGRSMSASDLLACVHEVFENTFEK